MQSRLSLASNSLLPNIMFVTARVVKLRNSLKIKKYLKIVLKNYLIDFRELKISIYYNFCNTILN